MFAITHSILGRAARRSALSTLGLVFLASCGGEGPTGGIPRPIPTVAAVSRVAVTPSPTLVVFTKELTATTFDANDSVLIGRTISWASSDPSLATVSASGLVTSVGTGWVTITATSEGKSGSADVQVIYVQIVAVDVTQPSAPVPTGTTVQLTAHTLSPTGLPLPRPVTWSSSDLTKAKVDQTGLVTTTGAGSVTITAACEGVSGKAVITVVPPPAGAR
ncbi:MAG: Ig-like domain-containing protein [Gemmatimonas sp.]